MSSAPNVGGADRIVRAVIGAGALVVACTELGLFQGNVWGIVAGIVGLVLLGTAALRFCPAYVPFRLSTCRAAR